MQDFVYEPPCAPSRCTWKVGAASDASPHSKDVLKSVRPKIMNDVLEAIGWTPMVRVRKLAREHDVQCQLLAKCEYLNPGGSLKDRIAPRMIDDAVRAGKIRPGCTLITPTSGNTGIGVALVAAVRGYRCIIVMPMKMSKEKADTMKALGAEILRTPNSAGYTSLDSPFAVAQKLQRQIPNSYVLDQYTSASNPLAHYDLTAEEILEQCDGQVDMMVIGTGTGGALTGIGRKLKERCPTCRVVAVDPLGSIMANPQDLSAKAFFEVEGIGHDFVPTVCDTSVADQWFTVDDAQTFNTARRLIRDEGLLCGGSSGANMAAALALAKDLGRHQKCVVLLPDGVRNYMTKFLSDAWMLERGFLADPVVDGQWWADVDVGRLLVAGTSDVSIGLQARRRDALDLIERHHLAGVPVVDDKGFVKAVVTEDSLLQAALQGRGAADAGVVDSVSARFRKVTSETRLGRVARILHAEPMVVVVSDGTAGEKGKLIGVVSKKDFLRFIAAQ